MKIQKQLYIFTILLVLFLTTSIISQSIHLQNPTGRDYTSLNGKWNIIVDPYENGYYDYRYQPNPNGYFKNRKMENRWDLIEYDFDKSPKINVPGDWNSQIDELYLYEGTVWYQRYFELKPEADGRYFIHFGAVNYESIIYVNVVLIGNHVGGFTSFTLEITDYVKEDTNFVVVKVDNKRKREAVPTLNTDWFNYGGITRDVHLIKTSKMFVSDYSISLADKKTDQIEVNLNIEGPLLPAKLSLEIPELEIKKELKIENSSTKFIIEASPILWNPDNPKLYDVLIKFGEEIITDKIGFRTISTDGTDILLNGKSIYLRGISIHEEAPFMNGARAYAEEHATTILGWAKELGCNFVRLAHYPHNEKMIKKADELGLLVWSENPVYWTILWENEATYKNAENQLVEMINRDKNRASVVLWSMSNETPINDPRLIFLKNLAAKARTMDPSRLITAALERHYINETTLMIDDPLGEFVDVIGCNEYIGWYDGLPEKAQKLSWQSIYDKPVIISEFGGGALFGHHGDELTRWTEEYQNSVYKNNIEMLDKVDFIKGMSPWILKDFRSPRRPLPQIQDFWNRKGLISDEGQRKSAFFTLQKFYSKKAEMGN
ncbi:MAG: beta-glucuronidase [Melioribacteraceae bacterium]|nr:beta-glucuronidase [Melioribacteraceae bacterium]